MASNWWTIEASTPFHVFFISCIVSVVLCDEFIIQTIQGDNCPYFGEGRYTTVADGLVNCSWYGPDACCKRTEVTSVFSQMDPLFGASTNCKNRMNYLMCYFCDPDQHIWINQNKVTVCGEFCIGIYDHCKEASFNGSAIGIKYETGKEFCEAQNFEVVDSKTECFKFDPTVFAHSPEILPLPYLQLLTLITILGIINLVS